MWIASSTSPPGGAGPSATRTGSIPRPSATAGASSSAKRNNSERSMGFALMPRPRLVEVGPQPALGGFDVDPAPLGVILELVAADARHSEILAVAVAEIEARHRRGRKHRIILGQGDSAGVSAKHVEQHG